MADIKTDLFIANLLQCGTADLQIIEDMNEDLLYEAIDYIREQEQGSEFGEYSGVTLGSIWVSAFYSALSEVESTLSDFHIHVSLSEHVQYYFNYLDTHIYIGDVEYFTEEVEMEYDTIPESSKEELREQHEVKNSTELIDFIKGSIEGYTGIAVAE